MNLDKNPNTYKYSKPKNKFFRWDAWLHYISLKKSTWNIVFWSFIAVIALVVPMTLLMFYIFNLENGINKVYLLLLSVFVFLSIYLSMGFMYWAVLKHKIWNARSYKDINEAKKFLKAAVITCPFFLIYLSYINKKQKNLKDTFSFNIALRPEQRLSSRNADYESTDEVGYTNTYEAQVHNFSRKRRIDEELDDEYIDELDDDLDEYKSYSRPKPRKSSGSSIWTKRPAPKKRVDPYYEPDEDDDDYEDYN
ncbi:hypothetical protein MBOVa_0160 [Mycoplasmopsis bovis 8790]|nr:hypothetical protein MBOVa_0160 [Mycoplasmopsis bovis 8790]